MSVRPDDQVYRAYREEVDSRRTTPYVRAMAFCVFVVNTLFIGLDRYLFAENFFGLLAIRLLLDVVLAIIFFHTSRTRPVAAKRATALATGIMLLGVIHGSGSVHGDYYVGLIMLFVTMPVLLPVTAVEAGAISSVLLGIYAVLPLLEIQAASLETYILHVGFLTSNAFVGVASAVFLERVRFTDFVRRKEIERAHDELRALDQAKSRFTANVHHELRTPLTLILAPLEAMLSGDFGEIPDALRAHLGTMRSNAVRLLKLINDLLELARIEGGVRRLKRRPVKIGTLVEQLVHDVRPLADRKGIVLESSGLHQLPMANVDPDAIERVVVNLLGNAVKFTEPGGRIDVRAGYAGTGVELTFADTGIGIPPDQLERIFDRFAQLDGSVTRSHEGSGIGLSLVKELVELHGGSIHATSPGVGMGTSLHVWLPLEAEDSETRPAEHEAGVRPTTPHWALGLEAELGYGSGAAADGETKPLESPRDPPPHPDEAGATPEVLVVEDNEGMRRLLVRLLGAEYRVRAATDGQAALEQIEMSVPDLVITDIMMPRLSGIDLCQKLKNDPRTREMPVMLLTSKAEREMRIEGLELGADDYVTKPFHPRELLARARSLVRRRVLQEELARRNRELEKAMSELQETEVQLVQAERLAAVGELAAGVAHEVNNPLNFALNSLATLRDMVGDIRTFGGTLAAIDWSDRERIPEQMREIRALRNDLQLDDVVDALEELAGIVTEGLDRTRRLVADLRDFGAPDRGAREPVDLRQGIDSAVRLMGAELRRARVRVQPDYDSGLPRVRGDRAALNQLCLNLLKNSVQALEKTGGTICVGLREEGSCVVLTVRDDGPGIPSDMVEKLFEPFFTTKAPGKGTGLGLSICRRIVERHNGSIQVESTPGEGATFRVILPTEESDASSA